MSVKTLLFSRDRAMQLDAVLRSFFLHCQDDERTRVSVLYDASSEVHARQYRICSEAYPEVSFVEQKNFRIDVLNLINPYCAGDFKEQIYFGLNALISTAVTLEALPIRILRSILLRLRMRILGNLFPALSDKRYMLFLVDDNLFVRDFCLDEITRSLQNTPDAMGFSLRLGKNVTHCYTTDLPQSLPEVAGSKNKILKFNWTTAESDFAYPLEVSSSVYRSKDVVPMIAKKPFENPNELEFQMAVSAGTFSEKMPFLLCPEQSLTFCNPLNMVQTSTPNRAGVSVEYNSEHLAAMFDQGYRIDVEKYSGFTPQSCHQEVPLEFYRLESDVVK